MTTADFSAEERTVLNLELSRQIEESVGELDRAVRAPGTLAQRRRRGQGRRSAAVMRVLERDGVLVVDDRVPARRGSAGRRRGRRGAAPVAEVKLDRLAPNQIVQAIDWVDDKLTPHRGLRRLGADFSLSPVHAPRKQGRILLLVHGTFSNVDSLVDEMKAGDGGAFLKELKNRYDEVLGFDHPTLAVSPAVNARNLSLLFYQSRADVDVLCHSRGGLVTRWWLEGFDRPEESRRRAVFVGSPLNGTGLAAPPNLRSAMSLALNIQRGLTAAGEAASLVAPFMSFVTVLFRVSASITSTLSRTPAMDAAVQLVPGLVSMSRVGNNAELLSLRGGAPQPRNRYFAVRSNFESEKVGWRFWKAFRNIKGRLADKVTDAIFDGPNDLVVDTASMSNFEDDASFPKGQLLDFGTTDTVHHTNYFRQEKTRQFIARQLV